MGVRLAWGRWRIRAPGRRRRRGRFWGQWEPEEKHGEGGWVGGAAAAGGGDGETGGAGGAGGSVNVNVCVAVVVKVNGVVDGDWDGEV
ncbi:MAG: hypothetical protein EXR73_13450 [Myxococcales bacterium]|nr:hypothetical protein [Myxococcales bacterium]